MIEKLYKVDTALREEVDALITACAAVDGFTLELYTDAALNVHKDMECAFAVREGGQLCGFLFVFAPTQDEVEINALVHPGSRRKGYFKALLAAAVDACGKFGYSRGYVFCNESSAGALQVMAHWQYTLSHIEYQMQYGIPAVVSAADSSVRLIRLVLSDVPEIAPLMAECFGKDADTEAAYLTNSLGTADRTNWVLRGEDGAVIGFCGTYPEGRAWNIFGLGVLPGFRRRGYGRKILDIVAGRAAGQGMDTLNLDVDSGNPNAISLYEGYGFKTRTATRYYEFHF